MFRIFKKNRIIDWNKLFESNVFMVEITSIGNITSYTAHLRFNITNISKNIPIDKAKYTTYSDLFHWVNGDPNTVIPEFINVCNEYLNSLNDYDMCFNIVMEDKINAKNTLDKLNNIGKLLVGNI